MDEGQDSFKIETPVATWFYHRVGAGFSSLVDRWGRDWIDYNTGEGSSGVYRGIPNLYFRGGDRGFFHPGHDGAKASRSTAAVAEDGHVVIQSVSHDDQNALRWDIFDTFAQLTVERMNPEDPAFWFLYEGTPGGRFDTEHSLCLRSTGEVGPISDKWQAEMPAGSWVAFTDPEQEQSLVLWQEKQDDSYPTSYFPMAPMTVFGFGRELPTARNLIKRTPARFFVSLVESAQHEPIAEHVEKIRRRLV